MTKVSRFPDFEILQLFYVLPHPGAHAGGLRGLEPPLPITGIA